MALTGVSLKTTVVSKGGQVRRIVSHDDDVPALYAVDVVLGAAAGSNVFRIAVGDVAHEVAITGR